MIKKLIKIRGVGRFSDYKIERQRWDGELGKETVIYGQNGTGKSTIALILRSLRGNNELILKKKSFGLQGEQEISLLDSDGKSHLFQEGKWSGHMSNIEIFDAHFIEDNIYTGSVHLPKSQKNLFEIVVGEEGISRRKKLDRCYADLQMARKLKNEIHRRYKAAEPSGATKSELKDDLEIQKRVVWGYKGKVQELQKTLGVYASEVFETYIAAINERLRKFAPYIEIRKFSNTIASDSRDSIPSQHLSYYLIVRGHRVSFEENRTHASVKYTLSEGDKSAIALAFFLARIDLSGDISNKIVVFDDPLSSFDYARKSTTISQLAQIAPRCRQLIILSHDINFVSEITQKLGSANVKSLHIVRTDKTNSLALFDIGQETLMPIFKDINVLEKYLAHGAITDTERREVIRCIRPIVEGIFRIKFFRDIRPTEWLGDMISKVRQSSPGSRLHRLFPLLCDLEEINDYSKRYHHSNPTRVDEQSIQDEELQIYVDRTLRLIDKI